MLNQELDTEEDFHDYLLCEWIDYQEYGDWWWVAPADYDAEKEELLGGVPGELGIMVNSVYLQFEVRSKPYAQDGTTFVPSEIPGPQAWADTQDRHHERLLPPARLRRGGRLYRLLGSKLRDRCSAGPGGGCGGHG